MCQVHLHNLCLRNSHYSEFKGAPSPLEPPQGLRAGASARYHLQLPGLSKSSI